MDAIGLIIFILFLLVKFLGKVPDIKDKIPKDWEKRIPQDWQENWPVPKEWSFPWEEVPETEGPKHVEPLKPREAMGQKSLDKGDYQTVHYEGRPVADNAQPNGGSEEAAAGQHPFFNSQDLVRGIIMSEVLQPPRSRQLLGTLGWRNYKGLR